VALLAKRKPRVVEMRLATPFSNYLPGNSWLHRLDARVKLLLAAAYVFAVFTASSWLGLLVCLALLLGASASARVPLRRLARGLLPVLVILAFTFVGHAFTLVPAFGFSPDGALAGLYFALRIVALVGSTTLLTLTSPLVGVSDAVASLLRPLRALRVPVEDIAMVFSIALRFIPLTAEEAEKVIFALAARGMRFGEGGPIARLRAFQPVLVPLFVGLFRRADALATAMESRCYDGRNRTRLAGGRLAASSLVASLIAAAALVVWGLLF
jgi:energy-coupling factor transport system permease protein